MISISPNQYSPSSSSSTASSSPSSSPVSSSSSSLPIKATIDAFNEYTANNSQSGPKFAGVYKNVKQLSMSAQQTPPPPPLANGGANSQTYKLLSQSNSSVNPSSLRSRNNGVMNASASSFSIENTDVPTIKSSPFQRNNATYASQQTSTTHQSAPTKPASTATGQLKTSNSVSRPAETTMPLNSLNKNSNTNRLGVNSSYSLLSHAPSSLNKSAKPNADSSSPKITKENSSYSPEIISVVSKNPPPPPVIAGTTTSSSSASPSSSSSSNASPNTQSIVRNNIFAVKDSNNQSSSAKQFGPAKANSSKSFSLLSGFQRPTRSNQPSNEPQLDTNTSPSQSANTAKLNTPEPANQPNSTGIVLSAVNRSFTSKNGSS